MRYVVLEHRLRDDRHWDLLLQRPAGLLRSWALQAEPKGRGEIQARPLPDHRLVYLNYSGPISLSRGWVRRWDQGTYRLQRDDELELCGIFRGTRLRGVFTLRRRGDRSPDFVFRLDQFALGAKSTVG